MADIIFSCEACGKSLEADSAGVGMEIPCPGCNASIKIPQAALAAHCISCSAPLLVADPKQIASAKCARCRSVSLPAGEPSVEPQVAARQCPACGAKLTSDFVICLNCGLNFKTGEKIKTAASVASPAVTNEETHGHPKIHFKTHAPEANYSPVQQGGDLCNSSATRRSHIDEYDSGSRFKSLRSTLKWGSVIAVIVMIAYAYLNRQKADFRVSLTPPRATIPPIQKPITDTVVSVSAPQPNSSNALPSSPLPAESVVGAPAYGTVTVDNAFDSIILFCQRKKLSVSVDPDIIEELGRIKIDIPDNTSVPLDALVESLKLRGFVMQQVAINPKTTVPFLTTQAG